MFASVTMLLLFVGLSHGFVSLLGRPVPFKWLDRAMYGPAYRIGVLRIVNLLWTLVIALVTQLTIILVC